MKKNILVVAAHPDDEIIGIGGTIARYAKQGHTCRCLILGEGQTARTQTRSLSEPALVEKLRQDTLLAAEAVGYAQVCFEDLPDNRFDSIDRLDVIKKIEAYLEQIKPDTIYTHYAHDLNIDHQICLQAVLTATPPVNHQTTPREIFTFETLSSTEWNFGHAFSPNIFVNIEDFIDQKLAALSYYQSEIRPAPHPRSLEIIRANARRWGSVIGVNYAEAFQVVRSIRY